MEEILTQQEIEFLIAQANSHEDLDFAKWRIEDDKRQSIRSEEMLARDRAYLEKNPNPNILSQSEIEALIAQANSPVDPNVAVLSSQEMEALFSEADGKPFDASHLASAGDKLFGPDTPLTISPVIPKSVIRELESTEMTRSQFVAREMETFVGKDPDYFARKMGDFHREDVRDNLKEGDPLYEGWQKDYPDLAESHPNYQPRPRGAFGWKPLSEDYYTNTSVRLEKLKSSGQVFNSVGQLNIGTPENPSHVVFDKPTGHGKIIAAHGIRDAEHGVRFGIDGQYMTAEEVNIWARKNLRTADVEVVACHGGILERNDYLRSAHNWDNPVNITAFKEGEHYTLNVTPVGEIKNVAVSRAGGALTAAEESAEIMISRGENIASELKGAKLGPILAVAATAAAAVGVARAVSKRKKVNSKDKEKKKKSGVANALTAAGALGLTLGMLEHNSGAVSSAFRGLSTRVAEEEAEFAARAAASSIEDLAGNYEMNLERTAAQTLHKTPNPASATTHTDSAPAVMPGTQRIHVHNSDLPIEDVEEIIARQTKRGIAF